MSHLWLLQSDDRWQPVPLAGPALALTLEGPRAPDEHAPVVLRVAGGDWVLLAAADSGVRMNGASLQHTGIRVLRDRDEITLADGGRFFFSSERLAVIAPFQGAQAMRCPRCRGIIEPETPVVVCPSCGAVSHQNTEFPCWTYASTCPLCSHPTAETGFQWTPEEL